MTSALPYSAAAERNQQPILEVLLKVLPTQGSALEIASGTGQHTAWFAAHLPQWRWQPTDAFPEALPDIAERMAQSRLTNVNPPLLLDVTQTPWLVDGNAKAPWFDAIFCANMLHIAPWPTCAALMQGATRHLTAGGLLITYGPYLEADVPTSPGNMAFDHDLRSRNPDWGIRHIDAVRREADHAGLTLRARHAMPANNLLLVWGRNTLPSELPDKV